MKNIFVYSLLFFTSLSAFSQSDSLLIRKFLNEISAKEIKKHVFTLASDSLEGRETGRVGQKKAAAYIANHFEKIGLESISENYQQAFNIREYGYFVADFLVNKKSLTLYEDYYFSYTLKNPVDIDIDKIVFLGYGIDHENYSDYKEVESIKGKVVIMLMGEPKKGDGTFYVSGSDEGSVYSGNINYKVNMAKDRGAAGVLLINENLQQWAPRMKMFFSRRNASLVEIENDSFFSINISSDVANQILKKGKTNISKAKAQASKGDAIATEIKTKISLQATREFEILPTSNVLGVLRGSTHPEEYLVITSHYDHIGVIEGEINYGADDNASGTSAVMELARVFAQAAKEGLRPRRSIIFMCVSGEEKGLLGSKWFTDYEPLVPLENIVANLNIDMIGRYDKNYEGDNKYVYLIGSDKLSEQLHNISEQANEQFTNLTLDYRYNRDNDPNRFYYRSDHYNFAKNDIPVIFYFNGTHPDYHQPGDTPDKIVIPKIKNIAQLIFATAWQLVHLEERITADKLQ